MSYSTWHEYGLGFCVDDIKTTPDKLLKLAALNQTVLQDVRDYLCDRFGENRCDDVNLTIDDFDDLEGDYCERGVAYVLFNVIDDFTITYTDNYDGTPYILYTPTYPWAASEKDLALTEQKVIDTFARYIRILTDEPIKIDYQSVENGG